MALDVQIIVNACAGTARETEIITWLQNYLSAKPTWQLGIARTGDALLKLADSAARNDCETVVAAGGDGTVNAVASAILHTGKTLAVLPIGTLNHFAKDLHLPLDIETAVETITTGRVIRVDVGQVNDLLFVNNSSLGLYPRIVNEREKQQRLGWGKWPGFLWAALLVLRRYPLVDVTLMIDATTFACRTPFVFVGNNKYEMEGFRIGARERLQAGVLSVYLTESTDRLGLLRLAFRALFGGVRREKDFAALLTREVSIKTHRRRLHVATDGEVSTLQPPLVYRILPNALKVIVPAPAVNRGD